MDKDFVLDQYVVLMAEMLAIPLTEVERPSVVLQMRLSADLPMQVMEFDVPQELEPAPVFAQRRGDRDRDGGAEWPGSADDGLVHSVPDSD